MPEEKEKKIKKTTSGTLKDGENPSAKEKIEAKKKQMKKTKASSPGWFKKFLSLGS